MLNIDSLISQISSKDKETIDKITRANASYCRFQKSYEQFMKTYPQFLESYKDNL